MNIVIIDKSEPASLRLGSLVAEIKGLDNIIQVIDTEQILNTLEKVVPRVVIYDINMNGDRNLSMLRKIREAFPETLIIALTSVNPDLYRRQCNKIGVRYCLDKENDFDKIIKIVSKNIQVNSYK